MGRRTKPSGPTPQEKGQEVFDTLFTAFAIILLAFFILLNSFATLDARRIRVTLGSLVGTFGLAEGGANVHGKGNVYSRSRAPMETGDNEIVTTFQSLREMIRDTGLAAYVELVEEADHRILRFRESILFPSGGDALSPKLFPLLDRLAAVICRLDRPVKVVGHTDPFPGSADVGNWGLSAARAVAVMRFLTEAASVPERLVSAIGRGAGEPLGPVDDPVNFARSRRVDVYFL